MLEDDPKERDLILNYAPNSGKKRYRSRDPLRLSEPDNLLEEAKLGLAIACQKCYPRRADASQNAFMTGAGARIHLVSKQNEIH